MNREKMVWTLHTGNRTCLNMYELLLYITGIPYIMGQKLSRKYKTLRRLREVGIELRYWDGTSNKELYRVISLYDDCGDHMVALGFDRGADGYIAINENTRAKFAEKGIRLAV